MTYSKYIDIKIISFYILVFVFVSCKKNDHNVIKVMSFNIHYGVTNNGEFDICKASEVIKISNPDLVMLQEVDNKTKRSLGVDIANELSKRTGLRAVFGKSIDYQGGEYGNAILTKFPIIYFEVHKLPFLEGTEQRSALEVLVRLASGQIIRAVSTHFDHTKNSDLRIQQSNYINKLFTDDVPTILAGDLNALPNDQEINVLLKHWALSFDKSIQTFPSEKPRIKIDYILKYPKNRWQTINSKVIIDRLTSDHFPLLTEVKILNK